MQAASGSGIAGCDTGRLVAVTPVTVISVRSGRERVLWVLFIVIFILGVDTQARDFHLSPGHYRTDCLVESSSGCSWDTITAAWLLFTHLNVGVVSVWLQLLHKALALGLIVCSWGCGNVRIKDFSCICSDDFLGHNSRTACENVYC